MKVLSIDVGIKNLACCLFDVSNNSYVIESWKIIDLCNENKQKCLCKKRIILFAIITQHFIKITSIIVKPMHPRKI